MRKAVSCALILMALSSCGKKLNGNEYQAYIRDPKNGLNKIITAGNFEYTLQYRPNEYVVYQELHGGLDKGAAAKRLRNLANTVWFNISFKRSDGTVQPLRDGVADLSQYNIRLNYFLNEAGKKIKLLYGVDTLHPADYLFETNYNLTPQEIMVVGFILPDKETKPKRDMQLSYKDEVFGTGIIKATYSLDDIKNTPQLIY